jgi:hypothetical protein
MHRSAYAQQDSLQVRPARGAVAVAVIALAISFSGCSLTGTTGQGAVTSETRQAQSFTNVEVGNGIGLRKPSLGVAPRRQRGLDSGSP